MDPFAAALDIIFASPMAEDAAYAPPGGPAVPIRIVRSHREAEFGSVRPRSSRIGDLIEIRRSEIAAPVDGAVIVTAAGVAVVVGDPELDVELITWRCEAPLLDRTVEIMTWQTGTDSYGDPQEGFTTAGLVSGASWQMAGREALETDQVQATAKRVFFVPWGDVTAHLSARDRLACDGQTYNIEAVTEIGTHVGVEIVCIAAAD